MSADSFAATTALLSQAESGDVSWDVPIQALWDLKLAAAELDAQKRRPILVDQIQWAERAARRQDAGSAVFHLSFAERHLPG